MNEFNNMNEQQAKEKILDLVKDYYEKFHRKEGANIQKILKESLQSI